MRLIVGLGNPGTKYRDTPHNAGFVAADRFAERHRLGAWAKKFQGSFRRGRIRGEDVGVLKPETYMNLSGDAVADAVRYLPLEAEDVILVFDEMDLPGGRVRIRKSGGAGGHNGIQSVIDRLGTREFPRVRIGVGRPAQKKRNVGFLLGKVRASEREVFDKTVDLAVDALDTLLDEGVGEAMNRYNGVSLVEPEEQEEKS